MQYALLLRPLAPSTTSWSPSLPEGGNDPAIGAGFYPFSQGAVAYVGNMQSGSPFFFVDSWGKEKMTKIAKMYGVLCDSPLRLRTDDQ